MFSARAVGRRRRSAPPLLSTPRFAGPVSFREIVRSPIRSFSQQARIDIRARLLDFSLIESCEDENKHHRTYSNVKAAICGPQNYGYSMSFFHSPRHSFALH